MQENIKDVNSTFILSVQPPALCGDSVGDPGLFHIQPETCPLRAYETVRHFYLWTIDNGHFSFLFSSVNPLPEMTPQCRIWSTDPWPGRALHQLTLNRVCVMVVRLQQVFLWLLCKKSTIPESTIRYNVILFWKHFCLNFVVMLQMHSKTNGRAKQIWRKQEAKLLWNKPKISLTNCVLSWNDARVLSAGGGVGEWNSWCSDLQRLRLVYRF